MVKDRFFLLLDDPNEARKFRAQKQPIIHAVVGIDPRRRDRVIELTSQLENKKFEEFFKFLLGIKTSEILQKLVTDRIKDIKENSDPDNLGDLIEGITIFGPILAPEEASIVTEAAVDFVRNSRGRDAPHFDLSEQMKELGREPAQADAVADVLATEMIELTDEQELGLLSQALAALGPTLSPDHAEAAAASISLRIEKGIEPESLDELLSVLAALRPSPQQAAAALRAVISAAVAGPIYFDDDQLLIMQTLALELAPEQAGALAAQVNSRMEGIPENQDLEDYATYARLLALLGSRLSQEDLDVAMEAVLTGLQHAIPRLRLLEGFSSDFVFSLLGFGPCGDRSVTRRLIQSLAQLPPANRAKDIGGAFLADAHHILATTPNRPFQFNCWLEDFLKALGPKMSTTQATAIASDVVFALARTSDKGLLGRLATVLAAVHPSREQAEAAIVTLISALRETDDDREISSLAEAMRALAPYLSEEAAKSAAAAVVTSLGRPVLGRPTYVFRGDNYWEVAELCAALTALRPTSEQAEVAITRLVRAGPSTSLEDNLLDALKPLAASLSAEQARRIVAATLEEMEQSSEPDHLAGLAALFAIIRPKLSQEHVYELADNIVKMMEESNNPDRSLRLAHWLTLLGPDLSQQQVEMATNIAQVLIAVWDENVAGANLLASLAKPLGWERFKGTVFEVLKYPTVVGETRQILLSALEESVPLDSSGQQLKFKREPLTSSWIDLWSVVEHAEKHWPELDLASPPQMPERPVGVFD